MGSNEQDLDRDEQRIADLIGTLPHVDSPSNFDASVRARIAERRREKPTTLWRPAFAGVAAVAVLVLVGYLGFKSLSSGAGRSTSEIANTAPAAPAPIAQTAPPVIAPAPSVVPQSPGDVAASKQSKDAKIMPPAQQGGSIDEALKGDNKLTPQFIPSQRKPGDTAPIGGGQIPVTMIFQGIGLHTSWDGNGWRVDSVDAKNVAGRSGVRPGDIIEAVNGEPVNDKTSFKGSFSGKSIRVRRDGAVIDIPFKP